MRTQKGCVNFGRIWSREDPVILEWVHWSSVSWCYHQALPVKVLEEH
jgi:hypothetical protein